MPTRTLPPGMAYEWSAMSYQEKIVGSQMYLVFAMALLLVYLVLAGQYESWFKPLSVIMAVPIALVGPVAVIMALNIDNNLYTQIGLVLLIALSAKNAILIVEVARELREPGKSVAEAAVEAARARFRPIVMTSFAFILGVVPLVLAQGAGANARRLDRHHGVHRHAGVDLHCHSVLAVDVRRRAGLRGLVGEQGTPGRGRSGAGGLSRGRRAVARGLTNSSGIVSGCVRSQTAIDDWGR